MSLVLEPANGQVTCGDRSWMMLKKLARLTMVLRGSCSTLRLLSTFCRACPLWLSLLLGGWFFDFDCLEFFPCFQCPTVSRLWPNLWTSFVFWWGLLALAPDSRSLMPLGSVMSMIGKWWLQLLRVFNAPSSPLVILPEPWIWALMMTASLTAGLLTDPCGSSYALWTFLCFLLLEHLVRALSIASRFEMPLSKRRSEFWMTFGRSFHMLMGPMTRNVRPFAFVAGQEFFMPSLPSLLGFKHFVELRSQAMQAFRGPEARYQSQAALGSWQGTPRSWVVCCCENPSWPPGHWLRPGPRQLISLAATASGSWHPCLRCWFNVFTMWDDDEGVVADCFGSLGLSQVSWQEFDMRIRWAWTWVLASSVSHRFDFQHFDRVDVGATCALLRSFSLSDQGAYRKLLSGGFLQSGLLALVWRRFWVLSVLPWARQLAS